MHLPCHLMHWFPPPLVTTRQLLIEELNSQDIIFFPSCAIVDLSVPDLSMLNSAAYLLSTAEKPSCTLGTLKAFLGLARGFGP